MPPKSMISGMLSKSFKASKCKTSLKMAVARIRLLKNKREALVQQMRRELAQLLEAGQDHNARIRVEHVIKEEKTISAYDLIGIYCDLIIARLPIIESQKYCPIDLKEAISSVMFASPRCADIPELCDIQKHLAAKYGKEFVTSALEVRPDSGVSRMIIEKLSARAPDAETKLKVLTEVAKENNIKWEPKSFVDEIQKPQDDLLKGPTSYTSANKMMESSDSKFSTVHCWNNETTKNVSDNVVAGESTSFDTVPSVNVGSPKTSVAPDGSGSRYVGEEVKHTYCRKDNASLNYIDWSMEFNDAASAAKVAAESAERASMAARAAADLASRGHFSRQHSASHDSSVYAIKEEGFESLKSSSLGRNCTLEKPVDMEDDERKFTVDMKLKIQNLQRSHVLQTSSKKEAESLSYHVTSKGSCFSDFSESNTIFAPNYDTDGHSSRSGEQKEKLEDAEPLKPNLHRMSNSRKVSSAASSGHEISFDDKQEVEEFTFSSLSTASSVVGNDKNFEPESSSSEKSSRSFSLSHSAAADEKYESGGLNFGRLTGGLRNRGCRHPPFVRSSSLASSPGSRSTSCDAPPLYEKETLATVAASACEATIEESDLDDSDTKDFASRARASRSYADSKFDDSLNSKVQNKDLCDQRSNLKEYDGSSFRRSINYPNLGDEAAEELEALNIVTRRTRDTPSVAKEDCKSRTTYQSVRETPSEPKIKSLQSNNRTEFFSRTMTDAGEELNDKMSSKHQQPHLSAEEPSLKHLDRESSTIKRSSNLSKHELEQSPVEENEDPKTPSSTGKLTSRENSLRRAPHVHPKLPDYDDIVAHMRSLRSNKHLR